MARQDMCRAEHAADCDSVTSSLEVSPEQTTAAGWKWNGGQTLASLFSSLRTEDHTGDKRLKKWDSQKVGHQMRPKRATHTGRAFTTELIGAGQCAALLYLLNIGQCQSLNL